MKTLEYKFKVTYGFNPCNVTLYPNNDCDYDTGKIRVISKYYMNPEELEAFIDYLKSEGYMEEAKKYCENA